MWGTCWPSSCWPRVKRVLDVPPKLAGRVRLQQAGDTNNNDLDDAFSVAVAALRSPGVREASRDDHATVLKIWSKRYKDLGRTRTQVACCTRCGGGGALRACRRVHPGPARHRCGDPRDQEEAGHGGPGGRDQPDRAVCGRPVIAAAVIGDVRAVSRFPDRDHFAAYNGTAPVEVSSGGRKIWRLSRRGNRRLNHAIHMAAVTQIRCRHSQGRAYYERKIAEGKTPKEALRCLKRQISDAIYACLQADARRAAAAPAVSEPGRATGERLCRQRGRLTPPAPALGESHSRAPHYPTIPAAADPAPASLSRPAAIPRERAAGSRTGRSPPRSGARRPCPSRPRADNARGGKAGRPRPTAVAKPGPLPHRSALPP